MASMLHHWQPKRIPLLSILHLPMLILPALQVSFLRLGSAYRYLEESVIVCKGQWELEGKVTKPKGDQKFPCVVLVHGSGKHY